MFVSQVLKILAALLVLFSVISICIFISNLLRMHLEKVKMNIGTFIAFGLSGLKIQIIYFQIILVFLTFSCLSGLFVSFWVGKGLDKIFSMNFVKEEGVSFFSLFGQSTFWTLFLVLGVSFLFSWITIRKMLAKTPGDLIYNR